MVDQVFETVMLWMEPYGDNERFRNWQAWSKKIVVSVCFLLGKKPEVLEKLDRYRITGKVMSVNESEGLE